MKRLLLALSFVAGILFANQSKAQVYIDASLDFQGPHPRPYFVPPVPPIPVPGGYFYRPAPGYYAPEYRDRDRDDYQYYREARPYYREYNPYYFRERHWRHWRRCY